MPWASSCSAACSATRTMLLVATKVMSVPARLTSAWPSGMISSPSGTGPLSWKLSLSSTITTGLSSRMAAFIRPLASPRRGGQRHLQPRDVAHPGVEALAVLGGAAAGGAEGGAEHHRHLELAAGHVVRLGGLVDELVHHQRQEVAEHEVDHRTHAGHGGADRHAGEAGFADGRVAHPFGAELLDQAGEHLEGGAGLGDVLAQDEHARVAAHLLGERLVDGLGEGDGAGRTLLGERAARRRHAA